MRNVYDCVEAFEKLLDNGRADPVVRSVLQDCRQDRYVPASGKHDWQQPIMDVALVRRKSLFQQEKKKYCMTG